MREKYKKRPHKTRAFFNGIASTTDMLGARYAAEAFEYLSRSDVEAMASDWVAVGEYIKVAMEGHVEESSRVNR
jgi:hypothetical protein